MAMREEFEREGKWLFRWRSFLPLFLIALFLVALPGIEQPGHGEKHEGMWGGLSLAICLLGLAVRMYTIGHAANSTSGRNTKQQVADSLNTTGIYSVVRHPLYLGNFLIWSGIALSFQTWWLLLICGLIFWIYYERIMFAEEEFLRERFGEEYLEWARNTPAFIPCLTRFVKPVEVFSLKTVLRKENDGLFAIIVVLTLFEVVGDLVGEHKFEIDPFWLVVICASTVIWMTLKVLKKASQVLA